MNARTIIDAIQYLALATATEMSDERIGAYVKELEDLKDESIFAEACNSLVKDSAFMPKIAEVRQRYRELLMRRAMSRPALGSGDSSAFDGVPGDLLDYCLGCDKQARISELRQFNGWCRDCAHRPEHGRECAERVNRWAAVLPGLRGMD